MHHEYRLTYRGRSRSVLDWADSVNEMSTRIDNLENTIQDLMSADIDVVEGQART